MRNNNLLELKRALQEVEHRLKQFPKDISLWIKKFEVLKALGESEEAGITLLNLEGIATDEKTKTHILQILTEFCTDHELYLLGHTAATRLFNLVPDSGRAQFFLGKFAYRCMFYLESIRCLEAASISVPNNPSCSRFNGLSHLKIGRSDISIDLFESSLNIDPSNTSVAIHSAMAALYANGLNEEKVFSVHQRASHLISKDILKKGCKAFPDGKRVGIISGDFYLHSVSFFSESLIEGLLEGGFDIFCYSVQPTSKNDMVTEKFIEMSTDWSEMSDASSEDLHQKVVEDSIDILFDLSGYMDESRPEVFQHRAAPIQINYIGYPHTTGFSEIDYRIVDNYTDPLGLNDKFTTEKLVRLPDCFLCFKPYSEAPNVSDSRFEEDGSISIRFGSFNNMAKITPEVIDTWATILNRIPNATLLIKATPLIGKDLKERLFVDFEKHGVDRKRLTLVSWIESKRAHLELYNKIDIHLDSFPYNGTTTTCEAAWQGVPTITFKGNSHRSRVGYSLMRAIGLQSFVGDSAEDYVKIAINKASDFHGLVKLRKSLRGDMEKSALMDKKKYGKNVSDLVNRLMLP